MTFVPLGHTWSVPVPTSSQPRDHEALWRERPLWGPVLGWLLFLDLGCRPLVSAPLLGLMSVPVCRPAFRSDQGLPVLWSSIMQGEELLKAISRVWRVPSYPSQMLALSHTPASYLPNISASLWDMGYCVSVRDRRHLGFLLFCLFILRQGPAM